MGKYKMETGVKQEDEANTNQGCDDQTNLFDIIEEFFKKYMDEKTERIQKGNVTPFFNDLRAVLKSHPENLDSIVNSLPDKEDYGLEEINNAFQYNAVESLKEEENVVLDILFEFPIENVEDSLLQAHSSEILSEKFHIHESILLDLLNENTEGTSKKLDLSSARIFFKGIFEKLHLTVTELDAIHHLNEQRTVPACIRTISSALFESQEKESETALSIEYLLNFLIKFINSPDSKLVAIDTNNELNKYLPDLPKELPKDNLRETSKSSSEKVSIKQTLRKTIAIYEDLFMQQKLQGNSTAYTEKLLLSLRTQLASLMTSTSPNQPTALRSSRGKKPTHLDKERHLKALDEIFHFYTKQYAAANVKKTFEIVQSESDSMNLGYFNKFLKDFKIELSREKIKELFVKTSVTNKSLTFEQFLEIIEKVAQELHKIRITKMQNEQTERSKKLKLIEAQIEQETNEELVESLKQQKQIIGKEKEIAGESLAILLSASNELILNSLYAFLELDNQLAYKKKLSGFQRQPFAVREKETKRLPKELVKNYVVQPKEVTEKLLEEVKKLKSKKIKRQEECKSVSITDRQSIPNSTQALRKIESSAGLAPLRKQKLPHTKTRFTLRTLEKISYKDIPELKSMNFKPEDLIEEGEEDPDYSEVLQRFDARYSASFSPVANPTSEPQIPGTCRAKNTKNVYNIRSNPGLPLSAVQAEIQKAKKQISSLAQGRYPNQYEYPSSAELHKGLGGYKPVSNMIMRNIQKLLMTTQN
eukprot:TRINITY_DN4928_c0_g1_i1.p1 TRINITY_DN4928_c0_g1~~TRINITY_DN4928_c0_g1_i1.p1  ORF type:complete len:761 (-),score=157.68 TRINITY_DN4928_c0_g1_i1:122-2404(-)